MNEATSIADHLIRALAERGVGHVFGIPGDYSIKLCARLGEGPLQLVTTCDEQGAGFAADAYARLRGLGAVCVTYGVGALKLANTTAQAFAERSAVVVLNGAPGVDERSRHSLLHHKVGDYDTQRRVFRELTAASAVLDDPWTALREIDRVLDVAVEQRRPVYLELPRDTLFAAAERPQPRPRARRASDELALAAALRDAGEWLHRAERPVLLAGPELDRFGLAGALLELVERTGIPVATTLLGKSVLDERHPAYLGVYQGAMSVETVRRRVEDADRLVLLGVMQTDLDLGGHTARLDLGRAIDATLDRVTIGRRTYDGVRFDEFVTALARADLRRLANTPPPARRPARAAPAQRGRPITVAHLFQRLDEFLDDSTLVIADTGDAMFSAAELTTRRSPGYLAPAYYASLGFAVPAALGAQLAAPRVRPLVLVGDGAFQMTGTELSTIARYGLTPIVVVLNNRGYLTERLILDGPFNDVLPWNYHRLPTLLGAGDSALVETEDDLERALTAAAAATGGYFLIEVRLDPRDASPALRRLGAALART